MKPDQAAKERPILFRAPMVRAILAGTKTQTRRVVKQHKAFEEWGVKGPDDAYDATTDDDGQGFFLVAGDHGYAGPVPCPYGQPGDRLVVRETWQYAGFTDDGEPFIAYKADGARKLCDTSPLEWADRIEDVFANLSEPSNYNIDQRAADRKWRPSIHMPRWASRIKLEIVSVRVERLNDISEADALAEGIAGDSFEFHGQPFFRDYRLTDAEAETQPALTTARDSFYSLWESINGHGSWDVNPWVWVVEFRRLP